QGLDAGRRRTMARAARGLVRRVDLGVKVHRSRCERELRVAPPPRSSSGRRKQRLAFADVAFRADRAIERERGMEVFVRLNAPSFGGKALRCAEASVGLFRS